MKINTILILSLIAIVACKKERQKDIRVDVLPFYSDPSFTPHWLDPGDESLAAFHQISPFKLLNQEGDTITAETFAGKI